MHEYTFTITNLNCAACGKVSAMILKKIDGVESVAIRDSGAAKVVSSKPLDFGLMQAALKEKGYEAENT